MPHILINRLKKLMQEDFPSQLNTTNPVLGKHPSNLPDHVLGQIDDIAEAAKKLFGPRIEPSHRQRTIMVENGFSVKASEVRLGNWHAGVIETPKGLISY